MIYRILTEFVGGWKGFTKKKQTRVLSMEYTVQDHSAHHGPWTLMVKGSFGLMVVVGEISGGGVTKLLEIKCWLIKWPNKCVWQQSQWYIIVSFWSHDIYCFCPSVERDPPLLLSWRFLPYFSLWKFFFLFIWGVFPDPMWKVKGQGCRTCTDCKAKFVILGCTKYTE